MVVLISFPAPPWNRRNEHRNKCSYKLTSPTDWILPIPSCITTFPYCNHCRRTELFIKIVFIFHQTVIKFYSFSTPLDTRPVRLLLMMMVLLLLLEAVRQTDSSISNERAKHTIKSPSVQGEEEEKSSSRDTQLCIATRCCCWMARPGHGGTMLHPSNINVRQRSYWQPEAAGAAASPWKKLADVAELSKNEKVKQNVTKL